jgi:hypothetical protein
MNLEEAMAACVAAYGVRGFGCTPERITAENRDAIRRYLVTRGVPSTIARAASLATLRQAWADEAAPLALVPSDASTEATEATTEEAAPVNQVPLNMPPRPLPQSVTLGDLNVGDKVSARAPRASASTPDRSGQDASSAASHLAAALALLTPQSAPVDEETVRAIVAEEIADQAHDFERLADTTAKTIDELRAELSAAISGAPRKIEVTVNGEARGTLDAQHRQFDHLLKMVAAGCNVWLAGPAGSGKTTAARNVAKALGRPFYFTGAVDTEYKLLGYTDAKGNLVRRPFREAWEHGGVFLFDEIDASLPGAVLALNAALAGDLCDFPDACIPRHPDFLCIAAANTFGQGANAEYVGRMKQDAAFLDRFSFLAWEIDTDLETRTSGNETWARHVQMIRAKVHAKGLKVLVTPRATYQGARLMAAGLTRQEAEAATIRKGMTQDQWASLQVGA